MAEPQRVLIIGGCGFVGSSLTRHLASQSYLICIVDLFIPSQQIDQKTGGNSIRHLQADISKLAELESVFSDFKPTFVIHLASWGMSGSPMLDPRCHQINVDGTRNAVTLCQRYDVKGFVYTSTYNVIFGGREIVNGDESLPYFPVAGHPDQYGPSKTAAEQLALSANGTKTSNGSTLITCSLRPAAIYGPEEQRHFPRIVSIMDSGLFVTLIGSATVDWVHIDNLITAYDSAIRLMATSSPASPPALAGRAYFISDGTPVNQNEFLRPICEARGVPFPTLYAPVWLMMRLAYLLERVHLFGRWSGLYSVEPFMTRSEVNKVAVTHYFSIDNAKRDLGYQPTITTDEGARRMGERYRQSLRSRHYFRFTHPSLALAILLGMTLTATFAFESPEAVDASPLLRLLSPLRDFSYLIFRSQTVIRSVFFAAVAAHVLEAGVALQVSSALGCSSQTRLFWFVQTVLYGYGSLGLLYERKAWLEKLEKKD